MWKGQIHIPGSGEMCMVLSSFFSVQKKKLRKRIPWSRKWVGRAWWSKSASSLETSVKHFNVSDDHRLLNLSPESFRSNTGCVCPWMLTGSRGSCSRRHLEKLPHCNLLHDIFYLHIWKQAVFLWGQKIFAAKLCPIAKEMHAGDGVATRLSHTSSTFHPTIQGGRLAWASYLWEKWQTLSSRGI